MVRTGGMMLMVATYALIASIVLSTAASATSIARYPITSPVTPVTFPDCYWLPSSYDECVYSTGGSTSTPCGAGVKSRDVSCVCDGKVQDNTALCPDDNKPSTQDDCSVDCHTYSWVPTPWSSCTVECGIGYQSRYVTCQSNQGVPVEATYCAGQTELPESQLCNVGLCTPQHGNMTWNWGEWTSCSASCGNGHETRDRWCVGPDGVIDDTHCDCYEINTYRGCSQGPCETFRWSETSFGACSVACGTGFRERKLTCISSQRGLVSNTECTAALGTKVFSTVELCHNKPCPHYGWLPLSWSSCSVTCGAGGEQFREVECVELTTGTVVLPAYCGNLAEKPSPVRPCPSQKVCEVWHWHVNSWTDCAATCGAAGLRTRTVTCVGWYPTESDNSWSLFSSDFSDIDLTETKCLDERPDAYETCPELKKCPICTYEPDGFGECSTTCGSGIQYQGISCYCTDTDDKVQADSRCDAQNAKKDFPLSQTCNTGICPTYHFKYSPFSACSATCGVGYTTRTATCVCDQTGQPVSSSFCDASDLLETQNTCNDEVCPLPHVVPAPYSSCSAPCGPGTKTRTVACVLTTHGVDAVVADNLCPDIATYATSEDCNLASCPTYSEKYGPWADCSATCDGGQSRTVVCVSDQTGVVDNKFCPGIPKEALYQPCGVPKCPIYEPRSSGWSKCSTTCDGGVKTQTWFCLEVVSNTVVDDTFCTSIHSDAFPTVQACQNQACVTCKWIPGAYGNCSAECGAGVMTRDVPCVCSDDTTDSTRCGGQPRPSQQQDCYTKCHTYLPHITGWGKCSHTCGPSGVQTRIVECVRDDNVVVDLSFCGLTLVDYPTSQSCPLCACDTPYNIISYAWYANSFGACDVTCGAGHQQRTVGCTMTVTIWDHYDDGRTDTIASVMSTDVPTAMCMAFIKPATAGPSPVQDCVFPKCETPAWVYGIPSCSVTCGSGVETRTAVCKLAGKVVADSQCPDEKDWISRTCTLAACETFNWNVTSYGDCSASCGTGVHQRTVTCISSLWGSVDISHCMAITGQIGPKPADHENCHVKECVVCDWVPGSFSGCSVTCGQGQKTRSVTCKCSDGSSDSASCTGDGYATSMPCTEKACPEHFHWVPHTWTSCDATCGSNGVEHREVVCVGDRGTVDETGLQCADLKKPDTSRPCVEALPECTVCHVVYSSWSTCSVTCNVGVQTRSYSYADQYNKAVDISECKGQYLPLEPLVRDCLEPACPTCTWQVASFSACSVSCGVGAHTRDVACVSQYGDLCPDPECHDVAPTRSDECELACCTKYSWHTGPYGECSLSCGIGYRTRDVYCHDSEGLVVDASYCDGAAPSTDVQCAGGDKLTCSTASWTNGEWSECSASCGAGTRTRHVWCRAPDGTHVDSSHCSGEAPESSTHCNLCGCESIDWEVTSWSDCSVSCGSGFITREVECRSTLRGYVPFTECTEQPQPEDHLVCAPTCWSYVAGEFGACTAGVQSRNVYCISNTNELSKDGSHCRDLPEAPPAESQPCGAQQRSTNPSDFPY